MLVHLKLTSHSLPPPGFCLVRLAPGGLLCGSCPHFRCLACNGRQLNVLIPCTCPSGLEKISAPVPFTWNPDSVGCVCGWSIPAVAPHVNSSGSFFAGESVASPPIVSTRTRRSGRSTCSYLLRCGEYPFLVLLFAFTTNFSQLFCARFYCFCLLSHSVPSYLLLISVLFASH